MDPILEIKNLCKRYGDHVAVDDISFDVPRGSVFGLLGPNGAGKTTTIRMIMRIIASDSGTVLLDGEKVDDDRRRIIGYLPEERGLYPKMRAADQLSYFGRLHGMGKKDAQHSAMTWLERFGLGDRSSDPIEALSHGNQQRVQLVRREVGEEGAERLAADRLVVGLVGDDLLAGEGDLAPHVALHLLQALPDRLAADLVDLVHGASQRSRPPCRPRPRRRRRRPRPHRRRRPRRR